MPHDDLLHRTIAALMASAVKRSPMITAADLAAAQIRDQFVRSHPLARAMIDNHIVFEELK